MNALRIFRYGFIVGKQQFVDSWTWKTWLGGLLVRLAFTAVYWVLLGKLLESDEVVRYLLIGNAIAVGFHMTGWAIPASTYDRWDGTYALLVASPSSIIPATIGRTFVFLLNGVVTTLATFLVLAVLFDLTLPMPESLAIVPLVILVSSSAYCFATFLGGIATRVPRIREPIINMQSIVLMTICGVVVPVTFWPGWVQVVANVLPVTHGLDAIRVLLDEGPFEEIAEGVALEFVVATSWLALSILLIDRLAEGGRRDGSIESLV